MSRSVSGSPATVLVVDDDADIGRLVAESLGDQGYRVAQAASGAEAHAALDRMTPDLIILDLGLPDANGLVLCGDLKARTPTPIIICSASSHAEDPILSRRLGAEDFVRKPFNVREFESRVAEVLRRHAARAAQLEREAPLTFPAPPGPSAIQRIGALVVDHARRSVTLSDDPLSLTPTEYRLLATLAESVGEVMTREELGNAIWGTYDRGIGRSIDVHVTHLRAKLGAVADDSAAPTIVVSRGFGYRLVPAATSAPVSVEELRAARAAREHNTAARAFN